MADENIVQPEAEKTVDQAAEKTDAPVPEQQVEPAPAADAVADAPAERPKAAKPRGRPKAPKAPAEEEPVEAPAEKTDAPAGDVNADAAPVKRRGRPKKAPVEEKPADEASPAPAKKRAPKAKKAPVEQPVEAVVEEEVSKVYTPEETVEILNRAIDRKRSEVKAIEKSMARAKRPSSIAEKQALIDYINADINAYVSVVADMTDDDSLLEGIDPDAAPVEVPEDYQKTYLDRLSVDDLENEQEAEELRADYCDGVIQDMCTSIGEAALSSKKMIKVLLDDPYALEIIGETIFYDDMLYDELKAIVDLEDKPKKKPKDKKSGKKGSKKSKKQKNRFLQCRTGQ